MLAETFFLHTNDQRHYKKIILHPVFCHSLSFGSTRATSIISMILSEGATQAAMVLIIDLLCFKDDKNRSKKEINCGL